MIHYPSTVPAPPRTHQIPVPHPATRAIRPSPIMMAAEPGPRPRPRPRLRPFLLPLLLLLATPHAGAVPMVYSIQQRASECLYSRVVPGESVTFSVFITSGAALKGTAYFEGPVAPPEVESGVELIKAIRLYDKGQRYPNPASTIYKEALVDFETDNWDDDDNMFEDDDDYDDDDYLDDDDVNVASRDTASADQRRKQRVQRVEARRRKYEEQKRRKIRRHQRANEGDAQQMTFDPPAPGWYRGCMKGSWYQVSSLTAEARRRPMRIYIVHFHTSVFAMCRILTPFPNPPPPLSSSHPIPNPFRSRPRWRCACRPSSAGSIPRPGTSCRTSGGGCLTRRRP